MNSVNCIKIMKGKEKKLKWLEIAGNLVEYKKDIKNCNCSWEKNNTKARKRSW